MEEKYNFKEEKLGNYILDIAAGPFGSNLKVECFVPQGFPIIDGANLKGFKVTDNVTKFVTEEKARSLHRSIAKRNDVIVTISGNVGQISYIPMNSKYSEYLVSQRQFRVTFDTTKVYVPYLIYYFHTKEGQHKILSFANQTGVPALAQPLKNFKNIDIFLPDFLSQKRIAKVLSSLDDKIELNRRINDNLEQQAQALFKLWFVDNVNENWETGKASDYYDISIGKTPPRKETQWFSLNPTDFAWVSISDMGKCGVFINNSSEHLTKEALSKFNIGIVPKNTVLLSFKLTIGRVAITVRELATNEAIAHFKTDKYYLPIYTYLALKAYNYANLGSTSSIATAINSKIIKNMDWIMPDKSTLIDFYRVVSPIFERIKNNLNESKYLCHLRDTLLPRLMSGELKINDLNC